MIGFHHANRKLKVTNFARIPAYVATMAYNEIWTEVLGEVTLTERELYNIADRIAVAVKKHCGEIVKHLLHYAACL